MIYLTSVCFIFIKLFAFFCIFMKWKRHMNKYAFVYSFPPFISLIFQCSCLIQLIAFEDSYFFRIFFFQFFFLFLLPRRFKLIFAWHVFEIAHMGNVQLIGHFVKSVHFLVKIPQKTQILEVLIIEDCMSKTNLA